jgi:hypothetical protein
MAVRRSWCFYEKNLQASDLLDFLFDDSNGIKLKNCQNWKQLLQ